jgi:hypothetical protein
LKFGTEAQQPILKVVEMSGKGSKIPAMNMERKRFGVDISFRRFETTNYCRTKPMDREGETRLSLTTGLSQLLVSPQGGRLGLESLAKTLPLS